MGNKNAKNAAPPAGAEPVEESNTRFKFIVKAGKSSIESSVVYESNFIRAGPYLQDRVLAQIDKISRKILASRTGILHSLRIAVVSDDGKWLNRYILSDAIAELMKQSGLRGTAWAMNPTVFEISGDISDHIFIEFRMGVTDYHRNQKNLTGEPQTYQITRSVVEYIE